MSDFDLLIKNAYVVTMDPSRRELPGSAIAVSDGRVVTVDSMSALADARAKETVDARGKVALPGFVNAHTHATHNLQRGGPSDERGVHDWLINVVNPSMKAYGPSDVRLAARLFCLEAIRAGITTFVDNADYARRDHHADEAIAVYKESGLRAIYGRCFFEIVPDELAALFEALPYKEPGVHHDDDVLEDATSALAHTEDLMNRHHNSAEGRIQVWPAPAVATATSREGLLAARDLALKRGTSLTIHVAESPFDRRQAGMSSMEYLDAIGFLGPEVLANHVVQVDYRDLRVMQRHGVRVAHNPVSNMFLANGIAPVAEMDLAGLTVGIGTDDCCANQAVNLLADMRLAALAQKARYRNAAAMTADGMLEKATINGARAVGMDEQIGSIEPGKKADIVLLDLARPQTTPWHSVASALVYQADGSEVDTVIVDGHVLMRERRLEVLPGVEEPGFLTEVQQASHDLLERAHIEPRRSPADVPVGP